MPLITNAIILFLSVALPGLLILRWQSFDESKSKYFLVFAGAYLFSMTIIHLIPDVFLSGEDPFNLGLYILIGFFIQKVLENFSKGVEHGHFHADGAYSIPYLMIALGLHSFLEGSIITDSLHAHHAHDSVHGHGGSSKILLGIVMHKIPAALALMALLISQVKKRSKAILFLLIFALASPLGLAFSEFVGHSEHFPDQYLIILFAIVAGSFLQISTTIFIESDPDHKLNWKRFSVSVLGALAAVAAQFAI